MEKMFHQQESNSTWIGGIRGARVAFKYHLISYVAMNVSFWLSWFNYVENTDDRFRGLPWPLYPMLFGAVALLFHFLAAYILPVKTIIKNEFQNLQ